MTSKLLRTHAAARRLTLALLASAAACQTASPLILSAPTHSYSKAHLEALRLKKPYGPPVTSAEFTILFDGACPSRVFARDLNCYDLSNPYFDPHRPSYRSDCTAVVPTPAPTATFVGAQPFAVVFDPFEPPKTAELKEKRYVVQKTVHTQAPETRYKFSVFVPGEACEPFDPDVYIGK
jgi:hypothetical protein